MNQLRPITASRPVAISLYIINFIDRSQFSIRSLPGQLARFPATRARLPSPLRGHLSFVNSRDQYKAIYDRQLDGGLKEVESDLHLEYLRREYQLQHDRQKLVERRGCMDVGCGSALEAMSQMVRWRFEVLRARIAQLETREKLKSTAKEGSSKRDK